MAVVLVKQTLPKILHQQKMAAHRLEALQQHQQHLIPRIGHGFPLEVLTISIGMMGKVLKVVNRDV